MTYTIRKDVEVVLRIHVEGEPLLPDDLGYDEIDDMDEAIDVWRRAQRYAHAAKLVADTAGVRLAELLGEGGAARIGDSIVRFRVKKTERCINPDGFAAFLTGEVKGDRVDIANVLNPNDAKRTWMSEATRDTFFEWHHDDHPSLTVTPIDKAPKYLQALEDGAAI